MRFESHIEGSRSTVDAGFKCLAAKVLPENSVFHRVIMSEKNSMPANEFAAEFRASLSTFDGEAK